MMQHHPRTEGRGRRIHRPDAPPIRPDLWTVNMNTTNTGADAAIPDLCNALADVVRTSKALLVFYRGMQAASESRLGGPSPCDWPDSPAAESKRALFAAASGGAPDVDALSVDDRSTWGWMLLDFRTVYRQWVDTIEVARIATKAGPVMAMMNAGEPRPPHRWTTCLTVELDELLRLLHPTGAAGMDGLGLVRCGLPILPPRFAELVDGIAGRLTTYHNAIETMRTEVPATSADQSSTAARCVAAQPESTPATSAATSRPSQPDASRSKRRRRAWVAEAMMVVHDHPDWPDSRIACEVGIDKSRLSRCETYKRAAMQARSANIPSGRVLVVDGGRALEADDDTFDANRKASRQSREEEDLDDRIDRDMRDQETQRNTQRPQRNRP